MVKLDVIGLETGYVDDPILKGIGLNISDAGFTGVIGPNGCGKSTLLRAITGVLPAWKGDVYLDGVNIKEMSRRDIARKVAVVPQRTQISFPFNVREVVEMGRTPYLGRFEMPHGEHAKVVDVALEKVGVDKLQERTIRELSGGEYQRMLIARALTQEPDLLLLDEATSQLDIGHRIEVMDLIKDLNKKEGLTVITIHHDLNLAARYCGEIMLMDKGIIHARGVPSDVLTTPHLRAVYGIEAEVRRNPRDDTLYVVPVDKNEVVSSRDIKVHVICGGGTGKHLLRALVDEGYDVSAGVLNVMDTDLERAKFLDVHAVTEAPFSPISEQRVKENLMKIREAEVVVVTDFPVGPGNLSNLEAALKALEAGKRVILMDRKSIKIRDHTSGEATGLHNKMIDKGVFRAGSVKEVMGKIG